MCSKRKRFRHDVEPEAGNQLAITSEAAKSSFTSERYGLGARIL
jgi:hypothetical protein